jgi:zinc protease
MRSRIAGIRLFATLIALSTLLAACGSADKTDEPTTDMAGTDKIFDIPYRVRDLNNGLRVIVVPTDYPDIVSIQIPVQTGSRNEVEPGKTGFAHFFEHMMFRGTEAYPADVYADILKKAGANQSASTTDDFTNFYITFTKADLEKVIELEADRFQRLKYSEEQFRTEALAIKGEYLKNYSNPILKLFERVSDLMFTQHTYKHTMMGFIEDIEAMPDQMDYAKLFFDRWYRPEKTVVMLVGDIDADETFALVEKYWGDWERGDFEVDIPVEPPLDGPKYEHLTWGAPTQDWLVMAFRGPAFVPTEKDMPALHLIASIYFSQSSDLYRKLVIQDRSVDQLSAYFTDQKDPGILMIAARLTDAADPVEIRDLLNGTLVDARTQLVSDRIIEETKSRLRYGFTSNLGNSSGIAAMLARFVHFSRTPETVNEVYRTYDSLTATDVRDIANKYFVDSQKVTMTLSNSEGIAGIDDMASVDALVSVAGMAAAPPESDYMEPITRLPEVTAANIVPVALVAEQSATSPLVDVAFLIHAGAGFDPEGKKGLAALTAAMVTDGGSEAMSIEQINEAMYPLASGFHAQVDKEMTRLSGQVHKDNLATWYELVRGQLLFPAWSESDFDRIKTQLRNAIRSNLVGNNDEELAKEALYASIYGEDHPYGSLNLGSTGDLDSITLEDIKQFYRDNYTIANLTVGLAGGYPEEFVTAVSKDLQKLVVGERRHLEMPPAPMPDGRQALLIEKETQGVAVSFGFPIELTRGDPDWVALWLARSYLGEHRSFNSLLYQRIREARGMNYGNYAYIEYFPRGMFQFHPDTNLARQQQIFQVWIRPLRSNGDAHFATRTAMYEIEKLIEEGISESDFETTRAYLSKFVSLLMDGQSRQLGYALDSQYYQTDDFAEYVRDGLQNLTLADVNRVIRENLTTDDIQYVFVTSDAADLRQRLVSGQESPMQYDADKPQELLDEDAVISRFPLDFAEDKVKVVNADQVFNQASDRAQTR